MNGRTCGTPDDFSPHTSLIVEQCLCCKVVMRPRTYGYQANRDINPSHLCSDCMRDWLNDPEAAMFELPRYRHEGRVRDQDRLTQLAIEEGL